MNKKDTKQNDDNVVLDNEEVKNNKKNVVEDMDQNENLDDQNANEDDKENIKEDEKSIEENLQEEINQLRDEKLRVLAEMENLRKRGDKERVDSLRYGSINLARDILSPDDNLTRALDAIPEEEKNSETVNNLIDGLKMVQREFSSILEKHGVKKIKALNMKFDHNFHQAMVEVVNDEVEEGTVITEMQSGYTMHNRLLRPSMVAVSKKSKKKDNNKKNDDKKL
jgi:molecular chaperone GrpE